uniref:LIM zinc-binding domain-containing protein n=1 Tax=Anopheles minimus TaxID=112268 RepID=A0A182WBV5_9DIPT
MNHPAPGATLQRSEPSRNLETVETIASDTRKVQGRRERDNIVQELLLTELRICTACGEPIADKYLFDIDGCAWHGSCLRCSVCLTLLERQPSCYFRDRQVYCRTDYVKS